MTRTIRLRNVRHARSFSEKMAGLLKETNAGFRYVLVFHLNPPRRWGASIHMLGMKVPIDVAWLDEDKKVVDVRAGINPWTLNVSPKRPASFILEMRAGGAGELNIRPGVRVVWTKL